MKRKIISTILCVGLVAQSSFLCAKAEELNVDVEPVVMEFKGESTYSLSGKKANIVNENKTMGEMLLKGDLNQFDSANKSEFLVNDGMVSFYYEASSKKMKASDKKWHLVNDSSKKVDDISLDGKMNKGVAIVQSSPDNNTWTTRKVVTDFFNDKKSNKKLYTTSDIELDNGCYYRVVVAYTLGKEGKDSKVLFFDTTKTKTKKCMEVYSFYISNKNSGTENVFTTPRKELGSVVNTGKDNGYSQSNELDQDDPHFGWTLGTFTINGFTREATNEENVFLKNVGDKITLWFTLKQDINKLNGDPMLKISEDRNGYDKHFQVGKTNFNHGTLIIQQTDFEGNKHKPIVYTDFLKANASVSADTKVQLFEEGDYELTLDYEIEKDRTVGHGYTNYKITFPFKIRNGNCMVYPFDLSTGSELSEKSMATEGFKLDMAKSRYLTIDVQKSIVKVDKDGYLTEDVRFNRPAKDNEEYTAEGIYTFTVKNQYSDADSVTKTIYVGNNKYYKALSKYGISVDELNEQIHLGHTLKKNGTLKDTNLEELN